MKLLTKIYTPKEDSILSDRSNYVPMTIGSRPRLATCTSVCWLDESIIISLNLYGNTIHVFKLDDNYNATQLQVVRNKDGANLSMSEHLSISNNRSRIAVCSAPPLYSPTPKAKVSIYNLSGHSILPTPIFKREENHLIHNVRFSTDDKYIVYTAYDDNRSINVIDSASYSEVFSMKNPFKQLKAKASNFVSDNILVVCYCISLINLKSSVVSKIVTYEFRDGRIVRELYSLDQDKGMEDIAFSKDRTKMYLSDQMTDSILEYSIDKNTGVVSYLASHNPDGSLSFPHGMDVSPSGKILAVANYKDDNFNLYQL